MKNHIFLLASIIGFLFPSITFAQEEENLFEEVNQDDLGNVTDEFQEYFFEALKQKAIENYEKAITALESCRKIEPNNAVVYFELGKNYKYLENYEMAVQNLNDARGLEPERKEILVELYHTHTLAQDYDNSIATLKDLIKQDASYREDLANLYMLSEQYDQALILLDELDEQLGINTYRNTMRRQIYARTHDTDAQIANLEESIAADPENEQNYLNLIYIYSEQGEDEEAFRTAMELLETNPGSSLVHLALYKFYLDKENPEAAIASMKIVFDSEEIDAESKYKVLNDFLLFVIVNPEWESEMMEVSQRLAENENAPGLYEKLGEYYLKNDQKEDALTYFEMALDSDPDNFELMKNTLLLQIETGKVEAAKDLSKDALEIFPAQPVFYLLNGSALNSMEAYNEAEEILTFGQDYLIGNVEMKIDFYKQLAVSYRGLGEEKRAQEYKMKAKELIKEQN